MNFKTLSKLFFSYLFTCFCLSTLADEVTITFNNPLPANLGCYDSWVEDGFSIQILPESVNSNCDTLQYWYGYGIYVTDDILSIDVSSINNINQITVNGGNSCSDYDAFVLLNNGMLLDEIDNAHSFNGNISYNNLNNYTIDEFQVKGCAFRLYSITIKYNITNNNSCATQNLVNARSGDVYVDESCHGIILTAPNGTCYRIKVNNDGTLVSEAVGCP